MAVTRIAGRAVASRRAGARPARSCPRPAPDGPAAIATTVTGDAMRSGSTACRSMDSDRRRKATGGVRRRVLRAAMIEVILRRHAHAAVDHLRGIEALGEFLRRAIAQDRQLPRQREAVAFVALQRAQRHGAALQRAPCAGERMRAMRAADRDQLAQTVGVPRGELQADHRAVGAADEGLEARDAQRVEHARRSRRPGRPDRSRASSAPSLPSQSNATRRCRRRIQGATRADLRLPPAGVGKALRCHRRGGARKCRRRRTPPATSPRRAVRSAA